MVCLLCFERVAGLCRLLFQDLHLLVDENLKKWLDLVVYLSKWVGFKIVISSCGRKDRVFNDSGPTRYSAYADVLDGFVQNDALIYQNCFPIFDYIRPKQSRQCITERTFTFKMKDRPLRYGKSKLVFPRGGHAYFHSFTCYMVYIFYINDFPILKSVTVSLIADDTLLYASSRMRCVAHTLQLAVFDTLKDSNITNVLVKVRALIRKLRNQTYIYIYIY
ncbi:hypothetical protein QTP88_005689 [Uroleucon formosanum]